MFRVPQIRTLQLPWKEKVKAKVKERVRPKARTNPRFFVNVSKTAKGFLTILLRVVAVNITKEERSSMTKESI